MTFVLTVKALEDLDQIWDYTLDTWSLTQAEKYYQQLFDCFDYLSIHADSGNDFAFIRKGLKGKRLSKHIIFYRKLNENKIEITRILHEQMDFENHFK